MYLLEEPAGASPGHKPSWWKAGYLGRGLWTPVCAADFKGLLKACFPLEGLSLPACLPSWQPAEPVTPARSGRLLPHPLATALAPPEGRHSCLRAFCLPVSSLLKAEPIGVVLGMPAEAGGLPGEAQARAWQVPTAQLPCQDW